MTGPFPCRPEMASTYFLPRIFRASLTISDLVHDETPKDRVFAACSKSACSAVVILTRSMKVLTSSGSFGLPAMRRL